MAVVDFNVAIQANVHFTSVAAPTAVVADSFRVNYAAGKSTLQQLTNTSSNMYLVRSTDVVTTPQPGVKDVVSDIQVQVLPLQATLEPVSHEIQNFELKDGVLSLVIGRVTYAGLLRFHLGIEKHRKTFGYRDVLATDLNQSQMTLEDVMVEGQARTKVSVKLDALGHSDDLNDDRKLRVSMNVRIAAEPGTAILNQVKIPSLSGGIEAEEVVRDRN